MNKLLLTLSSLVVSLTILIFAVGVFADPPETVTICHAAGQDDTLQYVTLTLPYGAVYGQAGHFSEPGTPNAGHENDYEGPCEVETTPTPTDTPTPTPTPGEEQHYACVENACSLVAGTGENTCDTDRDCGEEVTPTPTGTPSNPGGPGDGLSDGRSDGRSSAPSTPTQAVLGLSTTSSGSNPLLALGQIFAAFILASCGYALFKKSS